MNDTNLTGDDEIVITKTIRSVSGTLGVIGLYLYLVPVSREEFHRVTWASDIGFET